MRVAIDSGALSGGHAVRGIGFYTKNLMKALVKLSKNKKNFTIESFNFSSNQAKLTGYEIVHYPYFDLFFRTLPIKKKTKTIVTIHDVIPLIYPEHYPAGIRGKIRFELQKFSLGSVAAVITDTETSKKDIVRLLDVRQERVFPIHLAPADHFGIVEESEILRRVREKYKLPKKFVLYVGDINYNKNILGLVKAVKEIKVPLVIVGKHVAELDRGSDLKDLKGPRDWIRFLFGRDHPEEVHYKDLLDACEKADVRRLGFVPDKELVAIYNLATVYCQPSLYEGFGFPVLEAMASNCPVVANKTQALVEIAEGTALFCNSKDSSDMANQLDKVLRDLRLRKKLIKGGKKNVTKYSWKKTAEETLAVYEMVYDL